MPQSASTTEIASAECPPWCPGAHRVDLEFPGDDRPVYHDLPVLTFNVPALDDCRFSSVVPGHVGVVQHEGSPALVELVTPAGTNNGDADDFGDLALTPAEARSLGLALLQASAVLDLAAVTQ